MSGSENRAEPMIAFEYVIGTLTKEEREQFMRVLQQDEALQSDVAFWEEHLMTLHDRKLVFAPSSAPWNKIEARISTVRTITAQPKRHWQWLLPLAATVLIAVSTLLYPKLHDRLSAPNTGYVAVLTSPTGDAQLTALTSRDGRKMWLQWQNIEPKQDGRSLQLWAESKRDGQIRSIAVFESEQVQALQLDQAARRLIQDAKQLLLTEEEAGGSPLNEPSEQLIASGVCVRFDTNAKEKS